MGTRGEIYQWNISFEEWPDEIVSCSIENLPKLLADDYSETYSILSIIRYDLPYTHMQPWMNSKDERIGINKDAVHDTKILAP